MNWYALFVETGRETLVQKWIQYFFNQSICYSLVPKRRLIEKKKGQKHTVIRILFPGYVFIKTDMCIEYYYKLSQIPRLIKILNNGTYYSQIDEIEMASILKLVGDNNIIDYSRLFIENSKVCVKDGPLLGMEGILRKVDKHNNRAKIELFLMGAPRLIDVGIEMIYASEC